VTGGSSPRRNASFSAARLFQHAQVRHEYPRAWSKTAGKGGAAHLRIAKTNSRSCSSWSLTRSSSSVTCFSLRSRNARCAARFWSLRFFSASSCSSAVLAEEGQPGSRNERRELRGVPDMSTSGSSMRLRPRLRVGGWFGTCSGDCETSDMA
jgi:hypothetical protein